MGTLPTISGDPNAVHHWNMTATSDFYSNPPTLTIAYNNGQFVTIKQADPNAYIPYLNEINQSDSAEVRGNASQLISNFSSFKSPADTVKESAAQLATLYKDDIVKEIDKYGLDTAIERLGTSVTAGTVRDEFKNIIRQQYADYKPTTQTTNTSNMATTKDYNYYKNLYPTLNDTALYGKARVDNPSLSYSNFIASKTSYTTPPTTTTPKPAATTTTTTTTPAAGTAPTTTTTPPTGTTNTVPNRPIGYSTTVNGVKQYWTGTGWSATNPVGATTNTTPSTTTNTSTATNTGTTIPTNPQVGDSYIDEQGRTKTWTINPDNGSAYWRTSTTPVTPSPTPTDTTTPTTPTVDTAKALAEANKVIDDALKRGEIDSATAQLFKNTVSGWDWTKDVNMENVLSTFKTIKANTIDPYFREQTTGYINQLQNEISFRTAERERELESEKANAGLSIRQAKEGLESAGMTFTGKAIQELGKESAYAQYGQPNPNYVEGNPLTEAEYNERVRGDSEAKPYNEYLNNWLKNERTNNPQSLGTLSSGQPSQIPFGGLFYEGNVNQANRLLASGSEAAYKEKMQTLGTSAESALGTQASLYPIPGYTPVGYSQGSISQQQQQAYANTLNNLSNQQTNLNAYGNQINPLNQ